MLTAQQVAQFKADGFLKGGRVLSDDVVEALRDELKRVIDQRSDPSVKQPILCRNLVGNENSPVWQVVNIWEASEPYHKLIYHPQVCEEVAQLTGAEELRVWHDQIQYKPAEKGGVNMWHQDSPLWPSIKPKTAQTTAWIALDDIDESNGCMSMVPGSHIWGNQIQFLWTIKDYTGMPAEFEGHKLQTRLCPVKKGEVHYHHGLVWHGSHANHSNRPRRAIAIHYMTEETQLDMKGEHPMKPFALHLADGQKMEGEHFPLTWSKATAGAAR